MRICLAGAAGVIGLRLLPLLVDAGHVVAGMTRFSAKVAQRAALGAEPVVTRNLVVAAKTADADRSVAESITWRPQDRAEAVDYHERQVLEIGGVVARYGPGTYYEQELPPSPRIHVDAAAQATPPLLEAPSGIITIAEPGC